MSPTGKDLSKHLSDEMQALLMRHINVAALALPTDEVMLIMVHAGIDMLCSAIATSNKPEASEQIATDMISACALMIRGELPRILAKAREAVGARAVA